MSLAGAKDGKYNRAYTSPTLNGSFIAAVPTATRAYEPVIRHAGLPDEPQAQTDILKALSQPLPVFSHEPMAQLPGAMLERTLINKNVQSPVTLQAIDQLFRHMTLFGTSVRE